MNRLIEAESIVRQRYSEDDPNYGLLVMGCYALLSKFGDLYYPIVEKVMLETDFYIGDKPLSELLAEGGIDAEDAFRGEEFYDTELSVTAVSSPGVYLSISENGSIIFEKDWCSILPVTLSSTSNFDESLFSKGVCAIKFSGK